MSKRLRRIALIAGLVGIPSVGLLAWFWWGPAKVVEQVQEAAARRGLDAQVGAVELRTGGLVLSEVSLTGEGVRFQIEEVGVRGSLFALASDGPRAAEHLQARGVVIELDVEAGGVETLRGLRSASRDSSEVTDTAEAPGLVLELSGARIVVRDAHGDLLEAAVGNARLEGDELSLEDAELDLGSAPSDVLSLSGASLSAVRDEGWRIREAVVASGRLDIGRRDADEGSIPQTRERVNAVRAHALGRETRATGEAGSGPLDRFLDGATLRVESFDARRPDGAAVLRSLRAEATRAGDELHLVGEGSTADDGSARWDLWLDPETARGRGSLALQALPFDLFVPFLPPVPWSQPQFARVDAELSVRAEGVERIALDGSVELRHLSLHHERIAPQPVNDIHFAMEGAASWIPAERKLEIEQAKVRMGRAEVSLDGEVEWAEHYRIDLRAEMPATSCNDAFSAIPQDLLAEASGFSWRGRLGGRVRVLVDSRELDETELTIRLANGCAFETVPPVADLRRVQGPFIHRVREPDGTYFEMTAGPGSANWASIHATSPFFIHAVVGHEDGGFFRHGGFAVYAIREALVRNLRNGRYVYGASTISMQLAKNLFLHREKTLARKVQEVLLTWWLESALEKRDILELYFNVIEYGPSVYGISHAADYYFGRTPADLSPAESAYLACILPNPKHYHSYYERGEPSPRMRNRVARFLRHLESRGRIDSAALEHGLAELETMTFHRPGDPVEPRQLVGTVAELPFATMSYGAEGELDADGFEDFDGFDDGGFDGFDGGDGDGFDVVDDEDDAHDEQG